MDTLTDQKITKPRRDEQLLQEALKASNEEGYRILHYYCYSREKDNERLKKLEAKLDHLDKKLEEGPPDNITDAEAKNVLLTFARTLLDREQFLSKHPKNVVVTALIKDNKVKIGIAQCHRMDRNVGSKKMGRAISIKRALLAEADNIPPGRYEDAGKWFNEIAYSIFVSKSIEQIEEKHGL